MTILEASNTQIPILLRDLDLYKVILFDNYFKGTNNEEFASIIKQLSNNREMYKQGIQNSKNISDFYSKENVMKMWEDFYQKVMDETKV